MQLAHALGLGSPGMRFVLRAVAALVVAGAIAYGVVKVTDSSTHAGRCQELLTSNSRTAYIGFELEGCRADTRPRETSAVAL